MRLHLTILCIAAALAARGQVIIANGTAMAAEGNPDIVIQSVRDVANGSAFDFSTTKLQLSLMSGDQTISGTLVVSQLNVITGSNKSVEGSLTVTSGINFNSGFLRIGSGKLLYTGPSENLTGAGENSFVEGVFTVKNSGILRFPIGVTGLGYAPAQLEKGSDTNEIGMQVVNTSANLTPDAGSAGLIEIDNTHYWEVTSDISGLEARVSLSTNGMALSPDLSPVVVESDAIGGFGVDLGSASFDGNLITSRKPVSKSVLVIGGTEEVLVRIHDIITPYTDDDINDELYVENIEKFEIRNVTLLDRWGVPVEGWKKKENFTNYTDPANPNTDGYDFTKLSPGNYICVVEYGNAETGTRKISRMVTVLKTK